MSPGSESKDFKRLLSFISLESEAYLLQAINFLFALSGCVFLIDSLFITLNYNPKVIELLWFLSFLIQFALSGVGFIALHTRSPKLFLTSIHSVGFILLSCGTVFLHHNVPTLTRVIWERYICMGLGAAVLITQPYFIYIAWHVYKALKAIPNYLPRNSRMQVNIEKILTL